MVEDASLASASRAARPCWYRSHLNVFLRLPHPNDSAPQSPKSIPQHAVGVFRFGDLGPGEMHQKCLHRPPRPFDPARTRYSTLPMSVVCRKYNVASDVKEPDDHGNTDGKHAQKHGIQR